MKNKLKQILIILILIFSIGMPLVVYAGGGETFDVGDTGGEDVIKLDPIQIPLFSSSALDFVTNASALSWFAFFGGLATVGILVYWVIRVLLTGVEAVRSEGDNEKLQTAYKKMGAVFVGAFISFLIPLILSILGAFLGIGTIFNWPKMFSICDYQASVTGPSGSEIIKYNFYFQVYLGPGEGDIARTDYFCNVSGSTI